MAASNKQPPRTNPAIQKEWEQIAYNMVDHGQSFEQVIETISFRYDCSPKTVRSRLSET